MDGDFDLNTAASTAAAAGLAGHLRGLGASLCEHASLRAELAAVEFQAEKREWFALAAGLVVGCALVAITVLFAGMTAVILAWDTPWRDQVALTVLFVFLTGTALMAAWLHQRLKREHHPFARTVQELRRDAALLRKFQP